MKNNNVLSNEVVSVRTKKPLRELYKGIKLPVFRTLAGSLLHLVGTLVVATQADNLANISVGAVKDLSPVFTYALMCMIGYLFFFASVVADLGFVELAAKVRKKIWAKVMKLPMEYYDREGANKVISRVTSDPEYSYMPFKLLQLSLTLVALFLVALTGSASITELALLLLVGFVVTMVIMFITAKFSERGAMYVAGKLSAFTAFLAERFSRIRFIKAMRSEQKEKENSAAYIAQRYEADKYNAFAQTMVAFGQSVLPFILLTTAFLVGAILIGNGKVTTTTALLMFYSYGNNLILVFQFVAQFPSVFAATTGGSKKIVSIFEEKEEDIDAGEKEIREAGDLALEHVSFGYGDHKVLSDVSVTIPKGKVTAIIGPNGSGKTTILRILDRLYPERDGKIRIGQQDGDSIALRAWRERFGIVSQNAALFDGSIRENICYGVKDVKEEELQAVIRLSCLEDVIASHAEGLEFKIGVNGEKLSGGEAQRVAIARAMLKNPDYLVMDEATASLDPVTANKVWKSVQALCQGRTVIVVAHSYRAIEGADQVVVMKDGRIEDCGSAEELKENNEFFREFAAAR